MITYVYFQIYWGMDVWTSYVTASHILSFAFLRFMSIISPHKMKRIKRRHGKVLLLYTIQHINPSLFVQVEQTMHKNVLIWVPSYLI